MRKPIDPSYWVVPGQFLAGEYPGSAGWDRSLEKTASLIDAGISVFVDLTHDYDGLTPYIDLIGDATHRRFPIVDTSVPDSPGHTTAILDFIDASLEGGEKIYLHCWGGIGRTGTIVGCWLARHGHPGPMALERLQELWSDCPKSEYTGSPESAVQVAYIRGWTG